MTVSENSRPQMVSGEEAALGGVPFLTRADRGRLILHTWKPEIFTNSPVRNLKKKKKKKGAELLFSNCTAVGVDVHPASNRWITGAYYLSLDQGEIS